MLSHQLFLPLTPFLSVTAIQQFYMGGFYPFLIGRKLHAGLYYHNRF